MNSSSSIPAAPRIGAADLSRHVADAVQRAQAARQTIAEMSPEEVAQISGGALNLNLRIWAGGPFLPPIFGLPGSSGLPGPAGLPTARFG